AVIRRQNQDGWETLSIYSASRLGLTPVEKHVTPGVPWFATATQGLGRYASLGGMYSSVAEFIFGDAMAAGKVMALAAFGEPAWDPGRFVGFDEGTFEWPETLPSVVRPVDSTAVTQTAYANLAASVQHALRETLLAVIRHAYR